MSLHEELTKVVTAHIPEALFDGPGTEKNSSMCKCGDTISAWNTPSEQIHAGHIATKLKEAGLVAVEAEGTLRAGDRVMINSKASRFHECEGVLKEILSTERESVPYRVLLDEYPENALPFFKFEVVPGKKKPKYRIGEMVYINNRDSERHGRVCRVVDTESLGGDLCLYQLRMIYSALIVAEYEKNLKSVQ